MTILDQIVTLHAEAIHAGQRKCVAIYVGRAQRRELYHIGRGLRRAPVTVQRDTIDGLEVFVVDAENYLRVC